MNPEYKKKKFEIINLTFFSIVFFFVVLQGCAEKKYSAPTDALFTKLSPEECGISFNNNIKDDSAFNEFTYRNFYNGAGVAIGDINNDGLPDVFMIANQGENKLFLNKGKFTFEDITAKSQILKHHKWSTGVTMADVNGDGFLDIYICTAGIAAGDTRKNELYINDGKMHFKEMALKYNLQDSGAFHTQASFFDYDCDGDLDVFLLNNNCLLPTDNFPNGQVRIYQDALHGDKLLRNDNGFFTNITDSAGIFGSSIGFGLGVSVGDINNDNWPDIYISNDFFEKDYLYLNQGNGKFKEVSETYISHMSLSSMGADMADINNDGLVDIFTTDMLPQDEKRLKLNIRFEDYDIYNQKVRQGLHHQLMGNMLHLNNGDKTFSEIAQFAEVDATDWSWGALIFDLNNDGWKDIVVCNGMYLDVNNQDYIDFVANDVNKNLFDKTKVSANYEQLKSILVSKPLANYAFVNNKNLTFKNQAESLGLAEPSFSNGGAYADLDNDGDLDLIINNLNTESFIYRNNTTEKSKKYFLSIKLNGIGMNRFGIGASVMLYQKGRKQVSQNFPSRGFQSSIDPTLHFGLDNDKIIDSIKVQWPDGNTQVLKKLPVNNSLTLNQVDAIKIDKWKYVQELPFFANVTNTIISGNIMHNENAYNDFDREKLMPHMLSNGGPKLAVGDVNGDGLDDLIMGAAKNDTTKIFLQHLNGSFKRMTLQLSFAADAAFEDAGIALFDADGDGDNDLVIGSGGNMEIEGNQLLQQRLYINNGKGIFSRNKAAMPDIRVNASCVVQADYDSDGDIDIFIGGRSVPGQYGALPNSYLLQNNAGSFTDITSSSAPLVKNVGMVTDALWQDIDNDNLKDLIIVGEWMPITIFKNTGIKLELSKLNNQFNKSNGWWNCIKTADIDNDGDLDFVVGNLGLNTKFKADSLHPAKLYVNDFDKNGTRECIMAYYKPDGKLYPYYMKTDIMAQLPILKKQFLKYEDYADKTMEQIFVKDQLKAAEVREAYQFQTSIILNNGKNKFSMMPLPTRAQLAPVFSILLLPNSLKSINIFLVGNEFGIKPELGRYDANFGTFFINKGNAVFQYLTTTESGLFYNGEARDVISIRTVDKKQTIVLGINNKPLKIFQSQ